MISYEVVLLPIHSKQNTCAAILAGDESQVQIGKKFVNSQGETFVISSIGTHCEGYHKNRMQVLVKCSSPKCASGQYVLAN